MKLGVVFLCGCEEFGLNFGQNKDSKQEGDKGMNNYVV